VKANVYYFFNIFKTQHFYFNKNVVLHLAPNMLKTICMKLNVELYYSN